MNTSRRDIITGLCGTSCCALLPSVSLGQETLAEAVAPAEDYAFCSTLNSLDTGLTIEDFSPSQRQILKEFDVTDYGTFILSKKWQKSDGQTPHSGKITIGCYFMNGSPSQQKEVIDAAMVWLEGDLGELIDFQFGVEQAKSDIRIMLGGNRNNSFLGRDSLAKKKSEPTMRLANFDRSATVQHEFGHALGLHHEHLYPGGITFKEDKVIADMARQGWTEVMTRRNILNSLGQDAICIGDPDINNKSIMMYTIPSRWTEDGSSYSRAGNITARDRNCVIAVYSL